jgi:hypothetical protein
VTLAPSDLLAQVRGEIERQETGKTLADQAAEYRGSFWEFTKAAWNLVIPVPFVDTFHIRSLCEHYEALAHREIYRLLVTMPPGYAKSSVFSVFGPAWVWLVRPEERILSASHADDLATRDTRRSRALMQTDWYQDLLHAGPSTPWEFTTDENRLTLYSNDRLGYRLRTHVTGGTGWRGTFLQLDDPHNAEELQSEAQLAGAWRWWGETFMNRLDDTVDERGVVGVVGQRIGHGDLIGRLLEGDPTGTRWTHLCLPVRYDRKHKFRTPATRELGSGRTIQGDTRTEDGALLAPDFMDADRLSDKTHDASTATVAAQYQQDPVAKEGDLLKRALWRYYPERDSFYGRERFDRAKAARVLPKFRMIVHSWDTSVKDREKSDYVSGQTWGIPRERPADRWLLRLVWARLGLNATIEAMIDLAEWADEIWPDVRTYSVIEAQANGADAAAEIRGRVQGVVVWAAKNTKYQRAEAASPALDGRNLVIPGYANPEGTDYDPRTPKSVQEFVDELAGFPGGRDDQVDAWSQMVNWTRKKGKAKGSFSVPTAPVPTPAGMPS